MFDNGASGALAVLVGTDLTVADHGELAATSAAVGRLQAFVDHAKVSKRVGGRIFTLRAGRPSPIRMHNELARATAFLLLGMQAPPACSAASMMIASPLPAESSSKSCGSLELARRHDDEHRSHGRGGLRYTSRTDAS